MTKHFVENYDPSRNCIVLKIIDRTTQSTAEGNTNCCCTSCLYVRVSAVAFGSRELYISDMDQTRISTEEAGGCALTGGTCLDARRLRLVGHAVAVRLLLVLPSLGP